VTFRSGMPSNSTSMSAAESIATPQWPTSPYERASSESQPVSVGISNATDSPPPPAARIILYRALVCAAFPNPATAGLSTHGRDRQSHRAPS
jgi:hypothetical protein